MKKLSAVILSIVLIFSFTACSQNNEKSPSSEAVGSDNTSAFVQEKSENESKILVAYFSATNTTKTVASYIADSLNCDIYEITPQEPYSPDDLEYNNSNSRTSIEMNDKNARPAVSGSVDNMQQYDIVFIGYPIWWGDAPRIINTFLESYDFSGKTIVPFCTSGSSDISQSELNLKAVYSDAKWLDGKRFSSSTSQSEIEEWLNGLSLK